jgi:hypothetical protein
LRGLGCRLLGHGDNDRGCSSIDRTMHRRAHVIARVMRILSKPRRGRESYPPRAKTIGPMVKEPPTPPVIAL